MVNDIIKKTNWRY